jgi:ATP-dependent DNA ligase
MNYTVNNDFCNKETAKNIINFCLENGEPFSYRPTETWDCRRIYDLDFKKRIIDSLTGNYKNGNYKLWFDYNEFKLKNVYLDGELYSHGLKLNVISSLVMKKRELTSKELEDSKKIVYMVFDTLVEYSTFEQRFQLLKSYFKNKSSKANYIKIVDCLIAKNKEEVYKLNDKYLMDGYEGIIVRNKSGLYVYKKKSYDVLRTKEFKHGLFTIVGGKIGTGSYTNTIIWELKCNKSNSKKNFNAIQSGTEYERKKIYNAFQKNPYDFIGKKVKVKYLDIDDYGCIIRNPIVQEFV